MGGTRRHSPTCLWWAAAALALPLWAGAQIHVERDSEGRVLITDQERGGERVHPYVGSGIKWQRRAGHLEVQDPATSVWGKAPADFPDVLAGERLLVAYGSPAASAVYDSTRHAWIGQAQGFRMAFVSKGLALGLGGPSAQGLYDSRTGSWQAVSIPFEQVALSENLALFFGARMPATIYDGTRGRWVKLPAAFGYGIVGKRLACVYGGDEGLSGIYDGGEGRYYPSPTPILAVRIRNEVSVALQMGNRAAVFISGCGEWAAFPGEADKVDIASGSAVVFDKAGNAWTYVQETRSFVKTGKADLNLPSAMGRYTGFYAYSRGGYYQGEYYRGSTPSDTGAGTSVYETCGCPSYSDDDP